MVAFSASRLVCRAIASIDPETLATSRQRRADGGQAMLDAADGFDQFGDMLDRGLDRGARLGDFADGGGRRRLHRLRGAGDAVIGGDHGLGGFLQMTEPLGLAGDAARDLLQIAGDVGELDAEAADSVGELVDQPLADRRHRRSPVRFAVIACTPCGSRPSGGP